MLRRNVLSFLLLHSIRLLSRHPFQLPCDGHHFSYQCDAVCGASHRCMLYRAFRTDFGIRACFRPRFGSESENVCRTEAHSPMQPPPHPGFVPPGDSQHVRTNRSATAAALLCLGCRVPAKFDFSCARVHFMWTHCSVLITLAVCVHCALARTGSLQAVGASSNRSAAWRFGSQGTEAHRRPRCWRVQAAPAEEHVRQLAMQANPIPLQLGAFSQFSTCNVQHAACDFATCKLAPSNMREVQNTP